MKKLISFIFIAFLISCSGVAQKSEKKVAKKYAVSKTASERKFIHYKWIGTHKNFKK